MVKGRKVEKINWENNIYYRLDELFFESAEAKKTTKYEISSGTNLLSPPSVILDSIKNISMSGKEINTYSSPLGEGDVREAVLLYENLLTDFGISDSFTSVVTQGAADALRITFSYIKKKLEKKKVLTLGPQYSIIYQSIIESGLTFIESGNEAPTFLPNSSVVREIIESEVPDVLFLTQPNNPSGEIYEEKELEKILRLAKEYDIYIVYEKIGSDIYIDELNSNVNYAKVFSQLNLWGNTIIIDSFSKRRAISGLRLGYILAENEIAEYVKKIRFGDCPTLVGKKGIIMDLVLSGIVHYQNRYRVPFSNIYSKIQIESTRTISRKMNELLERKDILKLIKGYKVELTEMYQQIIDNENHFFETMTSRLMLV